jgi:hypothetical protein
VRAAISRTMALVTDHRPPAFRHGWMVNGTYGAVEHARGHPTCVAVVFKMLVLRYEWANLAQLVCGGELQRYRGTSTLPRSDAPSAIDRRGE